MTGPHAQGGALPNAEPVEYDLEVLDDATGEVVERAQRVLEIAPDLNYVRRLAFKLLPVGANAADYCLTLTPSALRAAAHYPETLGEFERVGITEQYGAHSLGQPSAFAVFWQQSVLAPGERPKIKPADPFAGCSPETLAWWAGLDAAHRSAVVKKAHAKYLRAREVPNT